MLLAAGLIDDIDAGDAAARPASHKRASRRRRLEAVLLIAGQPLPLGKLAKLAGLADATEARALVRELSQAYDTRGAAFSVCAVAGGYQLLTRSKLAPWVERFAGGSQAPRLSPPVIETLAIVAYRQPVLRVEVEAIRGVHCGEVLRQLMQRELLRIVGRSAELGRPLLYGTTGRFLQLYGLRSLADLPRFAELRRPNDAA
ncbi:MAG: SMC-Scp complex subunit ScpB [Planctomycetota bacterium]